MVTCKLTRNEIRYIKSIILSHRPKEDYIVLYEDRLGKLSDYRDFYFVSFFKNLSIAIKSNLKRIHNYERV